jgi:hypothetical protein
MDISACTIDPFSRMLVFASGKNRKTYTITYQTVIDKGDTWKYYVPPTIWNLLA